MKKIIALLMTICLVAGAFCISAFAADKIVMRVSADPIIGDKNIVLGEYDNCQDGWNDAMRIARDADEMKENNYEYIVVDLLARWDADDDGEFTDEWINGPGFDNDTIYIPEGAKVILNLNGFAIDRGLEDDENDGEVIFINDDAEVIINNGKITGGFSNSEGGGLYIEGGAKVTLNDVQVDGNSVEGDDGAAIYMYGGSTLVMNGGSISDNFLDGQYILVDEIKPFGSLCVKDSTVILNNVTIEDNYSENYSATGVAIHATNSTVKMSNCKVANNAIKGVVTNDIIYADNSSLTITDTDFINNNILDVPEKVSGLAPRLFYLEDSDLTLTGGTIADNRGDELFFFNDAEADITGVTIIDNKAAVIDTDVDGQVIKMTDCTLNNNNPRDNSESIKTYKQGELVMTNCDLGNTTFLNKNYVDIIAPSAPEDEDISAPEDEIEDTPEEIVVNPVSEAEALIGISGALLDGTIVFTEYYANLPYAWNYAMDLSLSGEYDRVVIDLYSDWTANEQGEFAEAIWEGSGIYASTLCIPENARVTLNLNGHTISRAIDLALAAIRENGMVLLIEKNADVIINDGTITGSNSNNSAGGIHINGASVILNNVNIYKNQTNGSNGAGIAVLDGSIFTMNGGSFTENRMYNFGTLYVNNSTATLDGVTMSNNRSMTSRSEGAAIYADNATVTVSNCVVSSNAIFPQESVSSISIIGGNNSVVIIENTEFTDNASNHAQSGYSTLISFTNSTLIMEGGSIIGNRPKELFDIEKSEASINGVTIADNTSQIFNIKNATDKTVTVSECTFNNNKPSKKDMTDVYVAHAGTLVMIDCDLGDIEFEKPERIIFSNSSAVGSIFAGDASTGVLSLISIVISLASLGVCFALYKKKAVPTNAGDKE